MIEAEVETEPNLLQSAGFPESLHRARSLASSPGLEGSSLGLKLTELLADESNLGRAEAIAWLRFYLLGEYSERILDEESTLLDILTIEIHVPKVGGATAQLQLSNDESNAVAFDISLFGSGGSGTQRVRFSAGESTTAHACAEVTFSAIGVLQLVEITNGADAGRQYVRIKEIGKDIAHSQTSHIDSPHCDQTIRGIAPGRAVFDLREGAIDGLTTTLAIESDSEWEMNAGIAFPNVGINAKLTSRVERNRAVSLRYQLPAGSIYEAYQVAPGPFWQWALSV